MSDQVKRLVSIPEAREILGGIGHTTTYELIKQRQLTKVNLGRRSFITMESIAALVDRLSSAATPDTVGNDLPPIAAAEEHGLTARPIRAPSTQRIDRPVSAAPDRKGAVRSRIAELDGGGAAGRNEPARRIRGTRTS